MLIICSIADMIVHKDIRIEIVEQLCKCSSFLAIVLCKVPIQVKVLAVASEAIFQWTILINAGIRAPIQASSDVINRDDRKNYIVWEFYLTIYYISYQHHTGI